MRRPPPPVALVARTHGLVGLVALVSVAILHQFTRGLPYFEFGLRTYVIAISIGALYCLTGMLVWLGAPTGRFLSRICGLLYLARPRLGSYLWEIMNSADYQSHFTGKPPPPPPL